MARATAPIHASQASHRAAGAKSAPSAGALHRKRGFLGLVRVGHGMDDQRYPKHEVIEGTERQDTHSTCAPLPSLLSLLVVGLFGRFFARRLPLVL